MCTGGGGVLAADGVSADFELFDDGTHGDAAANDAVWTRSELSAAQDAALNPHLVGFTIQDSRGNNQQINPFPDAIFWIIDSALKNMAEPRAVNDLVQMTDHIVNIRDDGTLFPVADSTRETFAPSLQQVALRFYEFFPDDYDFLTVFTDVMTVASTNFHIRVKNEVTGIGIPMFDNSSAWGSDRLQGANYIASMGAIQHETTHQWGISLDHPSIAMSAGGHWSAVDVPGYLFGLQFEPAGDGAYRITWSRFSSSEDLEHPDLELYLMGLVGPEEVQPHTVLTGVTGTDALRPGDVVAPTGTRVVTIEEIITVYGPRMPDVTASQKDFSMAGVLITGNRFASPAELALFSRLMEHYGSDESSSLRSLRVAVPPFAFSTGSRATMDTSIGATRPGS